MKFILQTFFKGLYFFLTDSSFRTFVWLGLRFGSARRYRQKKINVSGYRLTVPDARSFIWQYYEIFFKGYYDFKTPEAAPVIIDCGSNIGLSVIHFKQQYPSSHVYAFEADTAIYKLLNENIAASGLKGITVFNEAVWVRDEALFFKSEGADGGQISGQSDKTSRVNGTDLKRFMSRFETIAFLKIDIEGAEAELLPHIAEELHKVEHLFVEFHSYNDNPQYLRQVMDAITSAGHRIYIDNAGFRNRPYLNKKGRHGMDLQLNIFAYRI